MKNESMNLERRIQELEAELSEARFAYDSDLAKYHRLRERVSTVLAWCENKQRMSDDGPVSAAIIHCAKVVKAHILDD